jgi:protein-tyrosine sulfotransferase
MSLAPIFILSCERSGSTLLRYMLDTHPDITSPGELGLGQLSRFLEFVVSRTLARTASGDEAARAEFTAGEVRRIISELMDSYTHAKGKRVWCDKAPLNVFHTELLRRVFPEARYICLYRNCLDVIHSCLEVSRNGFMAELAPYVQKNPGNLLAAMMDSWVEKTGLLLQVEASPAFTHRVHYEELVNAPEETLAVLFRFLELPFEPGLLKSIFTVPHEAGGGDPLIRSTDRILTDQVGQGAHLDRKALQAIPAPLLARMEQLHLELGYPL